MSFAPSIIKRIQNGNVAVNNGNATGTSTLSNAVVLAKSVIIPEGATLSVDGSYPGGRYELTNTTTVQVTRVSTSGNAVFQFTVIEFY